MKGSSLHGVELNIALAVALLQSFIQRLISKCKALKKTKFDDNFFEVAIGNVPFGSYQLTTLNTII